MARNWQDRYTTKFGEGQWQATDWQAVTRPDWGFKGGWVQRPEAIENAVPADATPAQLLKERVKETYAGMVRPTPLSTDFRLSSTMEFADRMAPSLLLVSHLGPAEAGYRACLQHLEIVLFDQGLNVWSHQREGDRSTWLKVAWWRFELHPDTPYRLTVERTGPSLAFRVEGHECGCRVADLAPELYLGLAGQEGVNRFYDCAVEVPA